MPDPKMHADTAPVLAAFDKIKRAGADMSEPTRTVLGIGVDEARAGAPVRTGELVTSIAIRDVTPTGGELAATAPHAVYQDRGTRYVKGRRFMQRGADAIERAAEPTYRKWLDGAVERASR
jgi:hypothetical protein